MQIVFLVTMLFNRVMVEITPKGVIIAWKVSFNSKLGQQTLFFFKKVVKIQF